MGILGLENYKVGEWLHIDQACFLGTRGMDKPLPCSGTIRAQVVERICIKLHEATTADCIYVVHGKYRLS